MRIVQELAPKMATRVYTAVAAIGLSRIDLVNVNAGDDDSLELWVVPAARAGQLDPDDLWFTRLPVLWADQHVTPFAASGAVGRRWLEPGDEIYIQSDQGTVSVQIHA